MKILIALTFGLLTFNIAYDQDQEKFKGQNLFKNCEENLSVDFGDTDSDTFLQTISRLDNVELVWLSPRSNGNARYEFCYLVMNEEGEVGFIKLKDFKNESKPDIMIYPFEIENYHFYDAQCFRQTLEEHRDLKKFLLEK
jgi:hypothetical protein